MPEATSDPYGDLKIGSTDVKLSVVYQKGDFIRQCGSADNISFADFSTWVSSAWKKDLPDALKGVTIEHLAVTIETTGSGGAQQRTFAFDAVFDFPLGQTPAVLSLGVTYTTVGSTFRVSVQLQLTGTGTGMQLSGTFERDHARGWGLVVQWQAEEGEGLSPADLCDALGVRMPDELEDVLGGIELSSVVVRYWSQGAQLACVATVGAHPGSARAAGVDIGASLVFVSMSA
ncbi:hypothetical protein [Streptomyces sp. S186]|uniref:hypothetical protein n=1 Tax=Streptomyces sp. S186 TaxID=3434395 RepID=UPI003F668BEA